MQLEGQTHSYWMILICAYVGGAAFVFAAVFLIVQAATGHGSHAGNILRVGFGILSLFTGIFFLTVGTLYWKSSDGAPGNESR